MPVALTYPGVYVEEIPSGVHTITGVATSITAFIGAASRGPTNSAITINNFGDFENTFGGLWVSSTLGFAVRDFFLNGGSQAVVVRLYHAAPANGGNAPATAAAIDFGDYKFLAASEGTWGVALRVAVDLDNIPAAVATSLGVAPTDLFNLTVVDTGTGTAERFANLTFKDTAPRGQGVGGGFAIAALRRHARCQQDAGQGIGPLVGPAGDAGGSEEETHR